MAEGPEEYGVKIRQLKEPVCKEYGEIVTSCLREMEGLEP